MKRKGIIATGALLLVTAVAAIGVKQGEQERKIKDFTAFFDVQKSELNAENDIKELIAEITGAR